MKTIKNLTFAALAALAATLLFQTTITRADDHGQKPDHGQKGDHRPQHITFQKCPVSEDSEFAGDFDFEGTVNGDCGAGKVLFRYLSVLPGDPIVRFAGEYTITDSACPFKTVCAGSLDTRNGHIRLNGVVTEGPSMGDLVEVRAQLDGNCSSGTMTITPVERR